MEEQVAWIAMNMLPGLGPVSIARALERYGDPEEVAFRLPRAALIAGPDDGSFARARKGLENRARRELRRCRRHGVRILTCRDADYPAALQDLPDKPVLIYMKGDLPQKVFRVAVIGTRSPTAYGRRVATGLASGLAARGIEVVSGGARGIDTCAHRGALAEKSATVAVLGSGLLNPYPPENAELFEEIAGNGALVSEFRLRAEPRPFPPPEQDNQRPVGGGGSGRGRLPLRHLDHGRPRS